MVGQLRRMIPMPLMLCPNMNQIREQLVQNRDNSCSDPNLARIRTNPRYLVRAQLSTTVALRKVEVRVQLQLYALLAEAPYQGVRLAPLRARLREDGGGVAYELGALQRRPQRALRGAQGAAGFGVVGARARPRHRPARLCDLSRGQVRHGPAGGRRVGERVGNHLVVHRLEFAREEPRQGAAVRCGQGYPGAPDLRALQQHGRDPDATVGSILRRRILIEGHRGRAVELVNSIVAVGDAVALPRQRHAQRAAHEAGLPEAGVLGHGALLQLLLDRRHLRARS
mmetsp:Transcript_18434/g.52092  ORF Transcript_18434/g.52092 Transcript_18434/m.52092 type:complete len:283 (-) Transcript_18434:980-1828(-)